MVSVIHNDRIIFNVAQLIRVNVSDLKRCANILSNICHKVWCEVFSKPLMKRHRIKRRPFLASKPSNFPSILETSIFVGKFWAAKAFCFFFALFGRRGGFGVSSSAFSRISWIADGFCASNWSKYCNVAGSIFASCSSKSSSKWLPSWYIPVQIFLQLENIYIL